MSLFPKSLHDKINLLSLLLIAFTLPFHILLCSYSTALFVLNQIVEGDLRTKLKHSFKNKLVLLFVSFFLLYIIGLINSENISNGLFEIEKKVSLFIFPILLFPLSLTQKDIHKILLSFVSACFILSLIFIAGAASNYWNNGDPESFMLQNLTSATGIHRVYASMYFLFCIYILTYFQKKEVFHFNHSSLILYGLMIYLTVFIFLMASRMMVILTSLSLMSILINNLIQTKKLLSNLVMLGLFVMIGGGILLFNERIRMIMSETYSSLDKGNSEDNYTGPNMRIEIWKNASQLIKKNPFGVGTGDAQDELYSSYVSSGFRWGILNKFNAHNQYLQTAIEIGFIGLLVLVFCLLCPLIISIKEKNYLYLGLMLLFACACLSESMLATQKGVVFYAFFNALLAFQYPRKNP